jgi:hypothetical protein
VKICAFTSDPTDAPLIRLPLEPDDLNVRGSETLGRSCRGLVVLVDEPVHDVLPADLIERDRSGTGIEPPERV